MFFLIIVHKEFPVNNRTNRGLKLPLSQQRPESISSFIESKRAVSVRAQKKRVAREAR